MEKLKVLQRVMSDGVVAVLRGDSPEEVVKAAEKAIEGGIKIIEITMTVPFALDAIKTLALNYHSGSEEDPIIGAGTILDPETARLAILNGAAFIVSPSLNKETMVLCNRYRVPILPGVSSVKEVQEALECGADLVKLFPGNHFAPSMIKTIKGPYPQVHIMPTGGVSLENLHEWVNAGAAAVGIGSDLTSETYKTGDYELLTKKAEQYVAAYRKALVNN
ncbi:bifunctional 2-keto-4-hydroxyglutarate aldolase/2-keto-3-deoxy-6-phosphogluconate aldolase [Pullulanibacillus sp. KACC 23026]|uniref:bifunctional 2-keto-4-hydroxyglutarate aldolase/2-keto-3-deoxy-6-phosphogluconate aldolase n=1 Tax=Pullulanibacillus sp. KACC 23026 TaxID=3028315 RepID=UPI0023AF413B|nr:bifunctional 2-keto-4-hydroxyglutarate aldolase/2-keto-3-deoxy-6-phosphogluconate aldolase [Pullulanibacillus sp. KACC 23026]WEG11879.1 bifunctional 2-keto-4-hydroxyglutarate aldolase/2-keto-3-deoxy-6-phosphogluconate aldolase [Pullulanibacillus sp. KACC 23026]